MSDRSGKSLTTVVKPGQPVGQELVGKLPPEVQKDAKFVAKVKDAALTVAAKVYLRMKAATPAAMKVMDALGMVLDTPDDMKKLGYNPTMSSGVSHAPAAPDAIHSATGLSTHLVATIASHVLAKAAVWVKGRMGKAAESVDGDGVQEVAEWVAEMLADLHKSLGVAGDSPDAKTVAEAIRNILGE